MMWGEAGPSLWLVVLAAPVALVWTTAFAKVSLVLSALRLGISPRGLIPWSLVVALSLLVTTVIMLPVGADALSQVPALRAALEGAPATERASEGLLAAASSWGPLLEALSPVRDFMGRHTDPSVLDGLVGAEGLEGSGVAVQVLAFLLSELTAGLALAGLVLVPFVVVDLIVAQLLGIIGSGEGVSLQVALPLKIGIFLAAGGWTAVVRSLWEGYQ